jgi:putative tricarboxylic transport membrane protein
MRKLLYTMAAVLALTAGIASAYEPKNVECIAPANPGGGWDFTCRQVGKVLYDLKLTPGPVKVTNMPGAGGGVAFGYVVSKRNDDPDLLVAASVSTTTRLAQGQFPGMNRDMVRWLGTLGADYGVIAVAKDSPYQTLNDLVDALKEDPGKVTIGGGSAAGGYDHLKVLQIARAGGVEKLGQIKYIAFPGGGEAIIQVLGGHIQGFTGDISEILGHLQSGNIRALAVLAEERLPGKLSEIPTSVEQGINVTAPNWRGFYMPKSTPDEAYDYWTEALGKVYESEEWKQIMTDSGLMPFRKSGKEFRAFVDQQVADIEELSRSIGLIK